MICQTGWDALKSSLHNASRSHLQKSNRIFIHEYCPFKKEFYSFMQLPLNISPNKLTLHRFEDLILNFDELKKVLG